MRSQIFGSRYVVKCDLFFVYSLNMSFRTYGSGYPGVVGRGSAGRGFPFFFWPIVWPVAPGAGGTAYLSGSDEVGAKLTYS